MPAAKKYDTNKIRSDFISGQQTLRQLAEQYGCSYSYLASLSSRERWYPKRRELQRQQEETVTDALVERVTERSAELAKLKALTVEEQNAQILANAKVEAELEKIKTDSQHSELAGLVDLKDRLLKQSLEVDKQQQEHELKLEKMKITAAAKKSNTKFVVEVVYLVYNDGRLLSHVFSEAQQTDAEILTSMLTAVNDFVADSLGATGNIGNLEFGANSIVIEKGDHCYIVSMNYGEPSDSLRQGLKKQLSLIEDEYLNKLDGWDGDTSAFEGCATNLIKVLLESTVKNRSEIA